MTEWQTGDRVWSDNQGIGVITNIDDTDRPIEVTYATGAKYAYTASGYWSEDAETPSIFPVPEAEAVSARRLAEDLRREYDGESPWQRGEPQTGGPYIVTVDEGYRYVTMGDFVKHKSRWFDERDDPINVVAWMPLPKPYKRGNICDPNRREG